MSAYRDRRGPARSPRSARSLRDTVTAYLFISPSALVIGIFGILPLFFTVYVSLFRWRLVRGGFAGLDNYIKLFGGNPLCLLATIASIAGCAFAARLIRRRFARRGHLWLATGLTLLAGSLVALAVSLPSLASQGDKEAFDALRVTIWYSLCTVPAQLAAGLALALFLTRRIRGRQAFRVIYLMPYIAPTVATAAIFELLFSLRPDSFANQVLKLLGVGPLQWLQEPKGLLQLAFGAMHQAPGLSLPTGWSGLRGRASR